MRTANLLAPLLWFVGMLLALFCSTQVIAATWQEEVLLHDGQKIIVERTANRGGRHEVGQQAAIQALSLEFTHPSTGQRITWTSEATQEIRLAELKPIQLDVVGGTAFLVTSPVGCFAYNKWGRPNPPYVFFKYEAHVWQRIEVQQLPAEILIPNLIISSPDNEVDRLGTRMVSAESVRQVNSELTQPEFKSILRKPMSYDPECIPMVTNGKGLWRALAWFSKAPTLEACQIGCKNENFDDKTCPCANIFQSK